MPVGAIKPFLETFSKEGDVVADIFAGSGMTGLAAFSAGRHAKLSDISALGQHIAQGYLQNIPPKELRNAGKEVINQAKSAIGDLYQTKRLEDDESQEMIRAVWSFTYICPSCSYEMVYHSHLDENGKAPTKCPTCCGPFVKRLWGRGKDVPVRTVVNGLNRKQVEQLVSKADLRHIKKATKDNS